MKELIGQLVVFIFALYLKNELGSALPERHLQKIFWLVIHGPERKKFSASTDVSQLMTRAKTNGSISRGMNIHIHMFCQTNQI